MALKDLFGWSGRGEEKASSACIGCGACTAHCPQGLDVPAYMKEMAAFL